MLNKGFGTCMSLVIVNKLFTVAECLNYCWWSLEAWWFWFYNFQRSGSCFTKCAGLPLCCKLAFCLNGHVYQIRLTIEQFSVEDVCINGYKYFRHDCTIL